MHIQVQMKTCLSLSLALLVPNMSNILLQMTPMQCNEMVRDLYALLTIGWSFYYILELSNRESNKMPPETSTPRDFHAADVSITATCDAVPLTQAV